MSRGLRVDQETIEKMRPSVSPEFTLLQSRMRTIVAQGKFAGICTLVWQGGEVIHFDATGWRDMLRQVPIERDTIFRLASMSKPITSVAALILVEEGRLRLSEPIAHWLPEAAEIAVLRTPGSAIDDVVSAERPPTLLDLMTHTAGFAWGKGLDLPITRAMNEAGGQTPFVPHDPDTFLRRVCALPLIQQPGCRWHYGISTELLGIIVARAGNQSLPQFLKSRIFDPIGMVDTGFFAPAEKLRRLSVGYARDSSGQLVIHDDAQTGFWSQPPIFPAGGGGLLSTVDDYLVFARMLVNQGVAGHERILSSNSVSLMTSNLLSDQQRQPLDPTIDFLQGQGFGLGVSIALHSQDNRRSPGSFSWPGGYCTTWFADPRENLIAVLMSQVWQDSLVEVGSAFEDAVYTAVRCGTSK
jgi:CubicO group peptidase (beta-lactamase class C family)